MARSRLTAPTAVAVATVCAFVAVAATIGADARWLAALGRTIAETGAIPDGVPYATAPSAGWPNVPVGAELAFHAAIAAFGDRGLLVAQVLAVGGALALLAGAARLRGAHDAAIAIVLLLVAAASLRDLLVVRVQLFSFPLFAGLLVLLHRETKDPSRRIWLLAPLVGVWSNLHGAVLAGLAVAGSYLLFERLRREPAVALGVLAASGVALCATAALWRTPVYYAGVLDNEAARRGAGLWEPLSLSSAFDVVFVAASLVLVALALRSRPELWQLAALAGLTLLTVRTARSGVWLLFVAAVPASVGLALRGAIRRPVALLALVVAAAVALFGLARGPIETGASESLVRATLREARGTPILAEPVAAEQLVLAGGRVWLANPLDAFDRDDQGLYLDWADGNRAGDAALDRAGRAVVVRRASGVENRVARDGRFERRLLDETRALYVRRRTG